MDLDLFLTDIEKTPETMERAADALDGGHLSWPIHGVPRRMLLSGMGSSFFAAETCARRMRAAGLDAAAELASAASTWPASPDLTVVAISASGETAETLDALESHLGTSRVIALTNRPESALALRADAVVPMLAGEESGGVACRSFRHTLVALLALEEQLTGGVGIVDATRRAASATAALLESRRAWLDPTLEVLGGGDGTWLLAPAERMSSALQGALMLREGPRQMADACETGDWSHVDVYLTKTLDYRAVVFTGSRYQREAVEWMTRRQTPWVAVGQPQPSAAVSITYGDSEQPMVALLTEPLIPELIAAAWWQGPS